MNTGSIAFRHFRVHRRAVAFLFATLLWGTSLLHPTSLIAAGPAPDFAVNTSDGAWRAYSNASYTQITQTQYTVSDSALAATITDNGGGRWTLQITRASQTLSALYFPWQQQRTPLDADISDDIYYYPYLLGRTEKATSHDGDWTWWGLPYPGSSAAPLVVMADSKSAKIVAATNWPAKSVTPQYAAQRMILRYDNAVAAGGTGTFGALIATVTGEAATGDVPWQKALDLYRTWLDSAMGSITYPSWMWEGQGMLNVQLEDAVYTDANAVNNAYQRHRSLYPWLLMWGQMSPPLGSCCGVDATGRYYSTLPAMDPRFVNSGLPDWARSMASQGAHVGYYSAPYDSQYGPSLARGNLDTQAGVDWFTKWNTANAGYGANTYYYDTLARAHWGEPAVILDLYRRGVIPTDAMTEGIVDIYPMPGLVSGSLAGGNICGAPHKTPQTQTVGTFPAFIRYLLNDRLIYWGLSNDDYVFWGQGTYSGCDYATYCANGQCQYGVERQILLTGARIEMYPPNGNAIIDAIVAERQRVSWWPRQPRYLATRGLNLTTIPAASRVEVTNFLDKNGASLLAISNPNLVSGLSFSANGVTIGVPVQKIAILDRGSVGTPPSPPTNVRVIR